MQNLEATLLSHLKLMTSPPSAHNFPSPASLEPSTILLTTYLTFHNPAHHLPHLFITVITAKMTSKKSDKTNDAIQGFDARETKMLAAAFVSQIAVDKVRYLH
jgi:hypothetical protein